MSGLVGDEPASPGGSSGLLSMGPGRGPLGAAPSVPLSRLWPLYSSQLFHHLQRQGKGLVLGRPLGQLPCTLVLYYYGLDPFQLSLATHSSSVARARPMSAPYPKHKPVLGRNTVCT